MSISNNQRTTVSNSRDQRLLQETIGSDDTGQRADGECIACVIENRAKEVGIAVLLLPDLRLHLLQFVETSRTYVVTLTALEQYQPAELLVVASQHEEVATGLNDATRRLRQVALPRAYFDDSKGTLMLSKYAMPDSQIEEAPGDVQYLAVGAAGALLRHLEADSRMALRPGSLLAVHRNLRQHMHIDAASVAALEIIDPTPQAGAQKRDSSLYRLLYHTKTRCGARLLRANLLQPLADPATLEMRLDVVGELLAEATLRSDVQASLQDMPKDLDRMRSGLAIKPSGPDAARRTSTLVSCFILLRDLLAALPALAAALQPAQAPLLCTMRSTFENCAFADMLAAVNEVIDEDVQASKAAFVNKTQQCFAVRGQVDGFLDLARSIFCRLTEQIHDMAESLRTELQLPALKVLYAARRGFYFVLPKPGTQQPKGKDGERSDPAGPLPRGFVALEARGARELACTTHELNALNARLKDAANDCMLLTEQVLEGLQARLAGRQEALHRLGDALALLDMLQSLAHAASLVPEDYCRPSISATGPIVIVGGRHPIAQAASDHDFQANETYMEDCSSFHIVTGPNMSGKSTYLRQVALIVVMAQIGSFVPANLASIRVVDQLFTRIGTSDSIETNSSSFMVEMQEVAYITSRVTSRSLVIIDELGRATSTADGIGIAWALSEYFISLGTFTLFATHFDRLTALAGLYPNARLWHLEVDTSQDRLDFKWRLQQGDKQGAHYGLLLAAAIGFPEQVLAEARRIVDIMDREDGQRRRTANSDSRAFAAATALYSMAHKVACIAHAWSADASINAAQQLRQLQREARGLLSSGGTSANSTGRG